VSESGLPAPAPPVTSETTPFWDATAEGRLVIPRCDACAAFIWYPRLRCPACGSTDVSWVKASGRGTVYSHTTTMKGQGAYRGAGPYVLAYVELDEGPRMMTNIVGCDPDDVSVGQAVEVVFDATGEGPALPRFRPR
jgi:uncharacterized OB-fold protein